jgi:hypothetical protein
MVFVRREATTTMTKHTAGILGSLTEGVLRCMTGAELKRKADAIEATDDGGMSVADEADLLLINKELERRDAVQAEPPTWFLATCRDQSFGHYAGAQVFLVQAKAGAAVEDALRTYGIDAPNWTVQWEPLADLRYGIVETSRLTVIPYVQA